MPNPKKYNDDDVIRIILDVAGKFDIPTTTRNIRKKELVANLDYTDDLLDILQIELDKYVKEIKSSASVSDDDLGDCKTVQDVIDVVVKSLK